MLDADAAQPAVQADRCAREKGRSRIAQRAKPCMHSQMSVVARHAERSLRASERGCRHPEGAAQRAHTPGTPVVAPAVCPLRCAIITARGSVPYSLFFIDWNAIVQLIPARDVIVRR